MSVSENDVQNSLILFSAQRLTRFFFNLSFWGNTYGELLCDAEFSWNFKNLYEIRSCPYNFFLEIDFEDVFKNSAKARL